MAAGASLENAGTGACMHANAESSLECSRSAISTPIDSRPCPTFSPQEFVHGLGAYNIVVQANNPPVISAGRNDSAHDVLQRAAQQAQQRFRATPDILLVVLPDNGMYAAALCMCMNH